MLAILVANGLSALAATERYEYDAGGRLVRWIDGAGVVTEYIYDPSGNITEVRRGSASDAPSIVKVDPTAVRRGDFRTITVTGKGLTGAGVTSPNPALDISGLTTSPTQIEFDLFVSPSAPLGAQTFSIKSATGAATFAITVNRVLPVIEDMPDPIVLLPDKTPQTLTVGLSSADDIPHTVTLALDKPGVAEIAPTSVTFAPGETTKTVSITGLMLGLVRLTMTSSTLAPNSTGIFVTQPFAGSGSVFASDVGVVREQLSGAPIPRLFVAPEVGVVRAVPPPSPSSTVLVAPDVGVAREVTPPSPSSAVLVAPDVGVVREVAPTASNAGVLVAPDVELERTLVPGSNTESGLLAAPDVGVGM